MVAVLADLSVERGLLDSGYQYVIGVDEVGRGALAGPVTVGAALVNTSTCGLPVPAGLTDSKKLPAARRAVLDEQVRTWALGIGVGHASPEEIDAYGLTAALRIAGLRAISQLAQDLAGTEPGQVTVLLDGKHNWLAAPAADLFSLLEQSVLPEVPDVPYPVVTRVKADLDCASVSAASIAAKCARDAIMIELGGRDDRYSWAGNKGYGSADHIAALGEHGASKHHRRSWSLPGIKK